MVFQQGALYPHLSVRGNLAFGLKLRGTPAGEISLRVEDAARMLGIADLLDRSPGDLSYGQQQRVALGRAVVRRPALFLLDEPLANLDAALRRQLRREIRSLHQRLGTTMIYVTHDPGEAMALGQRIAILHGGRLQQAADPQALYDRPVNRFVASALGSPGMNFLDGRLEYSDGRGWFAMGGDVVVALPDRCREPLQSRAAGPITLGARPEHVRVMAGDDGLAIDRRHFLVVPAVVEQTEWHGGESQVHLAVVGQSLIARFDGGVRPAVSEQVHAVVAAEDLRFFDAGTGEAIVA
jgi:multiple sugar transport system ATP-binding protein